MCDVSPFSKIVYNVSPYFPKVVYNVILYFKV